MQFSWQLFAKKQRISVLKRRIIEISLSLSFSSLKKSEIVLQKCRRCGLSQICRPKCVYWSAPTAALGNNDMPKAREVDGMQTIPAGGRGGGKRSRGACLPLKNWSTRPCHLPISIHFWMWRMNQGLEGRPQPLKSNSLNEIWEREWHYGEPKKHSANHSVWSNTEEMAGTDIWSGH